MAHHRLFLINSLVHSNFKIGLNLCFISLAQSEDTPGSVLKQTYSYCYVISLGNVTHIPTIVVFYIVVYICFTYCLINVQSATCERESVRNEIVRLIKKQPNGRRTRRHIVDVTNR